MAAPPGHYSDNLTAWSSGISEWFAAQSPNVKTERRGGSGERDSRMCCSTERERRLALIASLFPLSLTKMDFENEPQLRRSYPSSEGEVIFNGWNLLLASDFNLGFKRAICLITTQAQELRPESWIFCSRVIWGKNELFLFFVNVL